MSSIYSSNRSSRRASHATAASYSPRRPSSSRPSRISVAIADLAKYDPCTALQSPPRAKPLWERRASAKSTEAEGVPTTDVFNLDLIAAYEVEGEGPEPCISPAMSDPPPRTSSLAHTTSGTRSLSVDTDSDGQRVTARRSQKGGWMDRPHPLRGKPIDENPATMPAMVVQSAGLPPPPAFLETDPSKTSFQKKHRRRMTICESKKPSRNTIFVAGPSGLVEHDIPPLPDLPTLSPSNSTTTSIPSLTPTTPLTFHVPTEDQIRRELEMMTLREGADPLLSNRYGGKAGPDLLKELQNDVEVRPLSIPRQRNSRPAQFDDDSVLDRPDRGQLRRRKSIIEYFRKSPVDKLLDLYLDEGPASAEKASSNKPAEAEKTPHQRRPSLARRMTSNLKSSKDRVPEVPPLPKQMAMGSPQSRFDFD